ncbi:hypothetical protein [Breoghania sp. L-A4]|uniref:hypothetical protein n=1 Tax=Breoghania sp. L-A4 TaxID=2304600 RepID=UPI000E35D822|nr:hypothetical protein [Breoghania sp. L-A4]AXS39708.1 hypothetical protein D1F64_06155 [Breoghania sp. L-A4]
MDRGNVSDQKLKLIANYVAHWRGRKTGRFNLITIANESGTKPPLVWVFNASHEFPSMAAELGPDQPLIGMRSLLHIIRTGDGSIWDTRTLADIYAADLLPVLGSEKVYVGGNCAATPVAAEIARILILNGCKVQGFIGLEWSVLPPLPVRCTLVFGAESEKYNPFLRNIDPWPLWRRLFPDVVCETIPGEHGTFLDPDVIPPFAGHVRSALSLPPAGLHELRAKTKIGRLLKSVQTSKWPSILADRIRLALRLPSAPHNGSRPETRSEDLPKPVRPGTRFSLRLEPSAKVRPGDDVLALWDSRVFRNLPAHQTAIPTRRPDGSWQVELIAPSAPGVWTLQTFLCHAGRGPQNWTNDTTRYCQVTVEGPALAL